MQRAKAKEVASQRPDHEARQVQLTGPTPQTVEQAYRAKTRAVLRMCKQGHSQLSLKRQSLLPGRLAPLS